MVMNTMPIKYAVPAGSVRIKLLIALAARYTGCTVRGWDVMAGLDTHPASQNSDRFRYSFGKTRTKGIGRIKVGQSTGKRASGIVKDILLNSAESPAVHPSTGLGRTG